MIKTDFIYKAMTDLDLKKGALRNINWNFFD